MNCLYCGCETDFGSSYCDSVCAYKHRHEIKSELAEFEGDY